MTIDVSVRNFGPISYGAVRLKPFTVFVGPNNSGKSFFSTLIYAATSKFGAEARSLQHQLASVRVTQGLKRSSVERLSAEIAAEIRRNPKWDIAKWRPHGRQVEAIRRIMEDQLFAYGEAVVAELERCLGSTLAELERFSESRKNRMEIRILDDSLLWTVRISCINGDPSIKVSRVPGATRMLKQYVENLAATEERAGVIRTARNDDPDFLSFDQAISFASYLSNALFKGFPLSSHYLPAARSGIMQSHKVVASVLVDNAAWVGTRRMNVPQMSGLVTDFIVQLLTLQSEARDHTYGRPMRNRKSKAFAPIRSAAKRIEDSILHGQILAKGAENSYPEILYKVGGFQAPLGRISSMISELAPVVLYMRHVLCPGDLLLIEEPEAHLHPESQRQFAEIMAALSGTVGVVLTTHSDYFLTQINNMIRAGTLFTSKEGVQSTRDRPVVLDYQKVSAYVFRPDPEGGTIVAELSVSKMEGIPDGEFAKVAELMYDQAAELQYKLLGVEEETPHDQAKGADE